MSHRDDEGRGSQHAARLREQYISAEPQRLLAEYQGLQDRLDTLRRASREEAARAAEQLQAAQAAQEALNRTLGSRTAALEASRKEILRLKGDLARVRSSRSMRLGRALLAPLGVLRGRGRKRTQPAALPAAPRRSTTAPAQAPRAIGEMTLAELEEHFAQEPTAQNLLYVVSRQWFQLGLIGEPARLLEEHPELVAELDPRERRTAERIAGTGRQLARPIAVPARSWGAAYQPESGRVMYCVHSTPAYSSNGYSTRTRGVAAGLAEAGADVTVVARAGYPWDTRVDGEKPQRERSVTTLDGVPYVHVPGAALSATPLDRYLQVAADAFVREARLARPELIQAASNHLTALPALIAARRLGVPFVYEVRGLWEVTEASGKEGWEESERYRFAVELETLVAREADAVLAITPEVAAVLEQRGVARERISVAPNAVDPAVFAPLPRDAAYAESRQVRTDVPVIGFAGSMVEYEGLDLLLEASALLAGRGVEHQVVLAGSGAAVDALKAQRDALGSEQVLLLGRLPMEEMPRLLSTFDIMPCPRRSLPVTELVSPLKPLEAFGCGKAVVLTDLSPHRTLAGPQGERALVVGEGDAAALADALERLIDDPDLRADLGRAARLWVLDERTWATIGHGMRAAHAAARHHHDASVAPGAPRLSDLRVGIIADEFTTSTLAPSVHLVPLGQETWRQQLAGERLDLVFVESAWKGNDGAWHRGVGHYSDEESTDIRALLAACRDRGIPSVFWNKEDPVHFARFQATAALCDHVFTTDAAMIEHYLATPGGVLRTASGLPFYAQPAIHNPLPSDRPYENTVAYAGTFYGQRYPERSKELEALLDAAGEVGLTIYDRQLGVPGSPYHFPRKYADSVRGVLPYDEVIRSYQTHLAHINVNSVSDSPTMFSRRVVEVAACGGVVLSGPGRGIEESLGQAIPTTSDPTLARAYFHAWATRPTERVREQWLQMRAIYRGHTIDTALALVARTAGLPVTIALTPSYGALVEGWDADAVTSLARQSLRPAVVFVRGERSDAEARLLPLGIAVRDADAPGGPDVDWLARWQGGLERTHAEDLLMATRFGDWQRITARTATDADAGRPLIRHTDAASGPTGFVDAGRVPSVAQLDDVLATPTDGVEWLLAPPPAEQEASGVAAAAAAPDGPRRVLVAGHDLKFARGLMADLERQGHTVLIDQWQGHNQHDEACSRELLAEADVVFCEWGLGNLVWYSRNVEEHQRLVVRVHAQEVTLPYLRRADHRAVDRFLFVGELMRQAAITGHDVPAEKAVVVPNPVDVDELARPKLPGAEKHLGLVGIVPRMKRLDRALDVLEALVAEDPSYRLFVKGKLPADYPWMAQRPEQLAWYERQLDRADRLNDALPGCVVFDGFGDDMPDWYRKIGVALSVSDHESFHLTLADGAASGALPAALGWGGADFIYPRDWLSPTVEHLVARIRMHRPDSESFQAEARRRFDSSRVLPLLTAEILGADM